MQRGLQQAEVGGQARRSRAQLSRRVGYLVTECRRMPGSGPHLDPSLRSPHPPDSLQTRMWCPWRQRTDPTFSCMSQPMGLWSWPSGRAALPSTTMPPSHCTGGHGRQASWPWSHWQSRAPSFMCRAPRWSCGCMSTRRCSARARSSAFWVGVHPAITLSPSPNCPSCPLPPHPPSSPQDAEFLLSWHGEATPGYCPSDGRWPDLHGGGLGSRGLWGLGPSQLPGSCLHP